MIDTIDTIVAAVDTVTTVVDPVAPATEGGMGFWEFISIWWGELALGFLAFVKVIVNLTPTEKDNMVFGWLDTLINAMIADRKVKG